MIILSMLLLIRILANSILRFHITGPGTRLNLRSKIKSNNQSLSRWTGTHLNSVTSEGARISALCFSTKPGMSSLPVALVVLIDRSNRATNSLTVTSGKEMRHCCGGGLETLRPAGVRDNLVERGGYCGGGGYCINTACGVSAG